MTQTAPMGNWGGSLFFNLSHLRHLWSFSASSAVFYAASLAGWRRGC